MRRARMWSPGLGRRSRSSGWATLMPEPFAELVATIERLERHYRDIQDIEFTIDDGRLYLLQTRSAKRTAAAAVKAAVSMVARGVDRT